MKETSSKKNMFFVLFIALIMITSVLGFVMRGDSSNSSYEYNGYDFIKVEGKWVIYIDDKYFSFDYLPSEVSDVDVGNFELGSGKIYIAYLPAEKDSVIEYNMLRLYDIIQYRGVLPVFACTGEDGCPDIPVVTCDNENKVIRFKKLDDYGVAIEDNCVILRGEGTDLTKVTDRFIYHLLGVM